MSRGQSPGRVQAGHDRRDGVESVAVPAIDDVLPRYDVHEVHSVALPLPPDEALALALATPVAGDPIVRALFRLRGLRGEGTIADAFAALDLRELARAGPCSALVRRRRLGQIAKRAT
jgi:hypothetical protein